MSDAPRYAKRVKCPVCDVELAPQGLKMHQRTKHGDGANAGGARADDAPAPRTVPSEPAESTPNVGKPTRRRLFE